MEREFSDEFLVNLSSEAS